MPAQTLFSEDFRDGIWTKHPVNPVLRRSQPWAESDYICEPNLLYADGLFRMWFAQMYPPGGGTALGYATSPDGFTWTKYPGNPVLAVPGGEVHRPCVIGHEGAYYVFAVQDEHGRRGPATMRRWSSRDGIEWAADGTVIAAGQGWENGTLSNTSVVVDEDGTWRMLYTAGDEAADGYFGYAWSADGLRWEKHAENPVLRGFYGGDPFLARIGGAYYAWHSEAAGGSLRVYCRRSEDMVHWERCGGHPQISTTQPWEQGVPEEEGGTTAGYYGHLTDATLCEAEGRVFLVYQGAQTPLGVATFDGTLEELAGRLARPPLSCWKRSPYGMVDGGALCIADNGSERSPLVAEVPGLRERFGSARGVWEDDHGQTRHGAVLSRDRYRLECSLRVYAGATHRVSVIPRYADERTFARFWLHDEGHTYYQECIHGLFGPPVCVGPNSACDAAEHAWEAAVDGEQNRLSIDGRPVGECRSSAALLRRLGEQPVHIGFSTLDCFAAITSARVLVSA